MTDERAWETDRPKKPKAPKTEQAFTVKKWDQLVSYALWRSLDLTQRDACTLVGISPRTATRFERSVHYPTAQMEAKTRFLDGLDGRLRRLLDLKIGRMLELVEANPDEPINWDFLKWWLERREPKLAPPPKQIQKTVDMKAQFFVGSAPTGFLRNPEGATEPMDAEVLEEETDDDS